MYADNEITNIELTEGNQAQASPNTSDITQEEQVPNESEDTQNLAQEQENEPCEQVSESSLEERETEPSQSLMIVSESEPIEEAPPKPFEVDFVLVSMDEGEEEQEPERPLEGISLTASYNEALKHVRYTQRGVVLLFAILSAISLLVCIVQGIAFHSFNVFALVVGTFFGLLSFFIYNGAKKTATELSSLNQTYEYLFFKDRIEYRVLEGTEVVTFVKINPKEMTNIKEHDTFYSFVYKGVSYAVRKSAFEKNSEAVSLYFKNNKANEQAQRVDARAKTSLFYALFELAVMALIALVYFITKDSSEFWYLTLIVLPFPVVSLILTTIKKRKDPEMSGSHVILSIVLLAIALAVVFNGAGEYSSESYTEEQREKASELAETVGIELPIANEYCEEEYQVLDPSTNTNVDIDAFYVYLTSSQMRQFNEDVQKTGIVWVASLNYELEAEFGFVIEEYHNSFFIYNITEDTYNSVPRTQGVCDYILVAYDGGSTSIDFLQFSK